MDSYSLNEVLHAIGQAIFIPTMIVLLGMVVITVWQVGGLVVEFFFERRRAKVNVPALLKKINQVDLLTAASLIDASRLLKRQKTLSKNIIETTDMDESTLCAFVQKLLSNEESHYRKVLAPTDLIAKLGPMFGLLCTLIPLGPGIVALGKGDIAALSASIGVAFDGTIVGVISAAICFAISYLRARWYEAYAATNEALAESLIDKLVLPARQPMAQQTARHPESEL
ncbi:transporter [Actinomycetota bacterium]|nr:transporter [Actinomycetota bacterium]